ncbi:MAG: hypothetical protein V4654_06265 [Bdellovibrionota bacterium]
MKKLNVKKKMWQLLAMSLATVTAGASYAGADGSGGGAGIFCPASVSNQPRVQLLDLYEGRINEGLEIPESNIPYEEQITQALNKLSFDFSLQIDIRKTLTGLKANHKFLPPGVGIHTPPDLGSDDAVVMPTGCTIGAIGFYEKSGVLKISSDAYSDLSETQKAAFWIHEAFYKLVRTYKEKADDLINAKSTREFVSNLVAENVTKMHLWNLSSPASWRNLKSYALRYENHANYSLLASVGKESDLLYNKYLSPLKLPSRDKQLKLVATAQSGVPLTLQLACKKFQHNPGYVSIFMTKEIERSLEGAPAMGMIPDDCQILSVSIKVGESIKNQEIPETSVEFKVYYGDEEILLGKGVVMMSKNSYNYTEFIFPLYFD